MHVVEFVSLFEELEFHNIVFIVLSLSVLFAFFVNVFCVVNFLYNFVEPELAWHFVKYSLFTHFNKTNI